MLIWILFRIFQQFVSIFYKQIIQPLKFKIFVRWMREKPVPSLKEGLQSNDESQVWSNQYYQVT
jgi:hypothetical protein